VILSIAMRKLFERKSKKRSDAKENEEDEIKPS
jgi:hypothetical protein